VHLVGFVLAVQHVEESAGDAETHGGDGMEVLEYQLVELGWKVDIGIFACK